MGTDLPGATQQVRTPAWDRIRVYMGPEERGLSPGGAKRRKRALREAEARHPAQSRGQRVGT